MIYREAETVKTLCLYYSRTNITREIMRKLASLLDADLFEYTDGIDRSGFMGYIRSCIDSFRKFPDVHIVGDEPDWSAYDRVIVAMPTWAESPCVVGKAFLQQYSGRFCGDLYLVVTHMAKNGYDKAIRKTYKYCAKEPAAYLSLQTKDHDPDAEIKRFANELA